MRAFLRYLIVLTVIIMIGWLVIPQAYGVNFPRSAGPTFDRAVRYIYMHRIEDENPQIVLLGDSTLSDSINADLLGTLTGKKIAKFDVHGSASAYWYLILKNNIIEAENTPPVVVIVFRDTILTAPGYRVHGSYLKRLDEFARRKEPLLLERSYLNLMNPVERVAESYVPLYGARENIRQSMDGWLRYTLPGWMGCDQRCTDNSMYAVF